MKDFLQQHGQHVLGVLSGWDRLRFRGTLQSICHSRGLGAFLGCTRRFYKGFKAFALESSAQLREAALKVAQQASRPVIYLRSMHTNKEQVARHCAQQDGIKEGLICAIKVVEPCSSFVIRRNADGGFDFQAHRPNSLHIYHYYMHPVFGFMHVRLQTWLPFSQFICINGREWLSRQLDAAGIDYLRKDNCFVRLGDVDAAQHFMNQQARFDWRPTLDQLALSIAPTLRQVLKPYPLNYYWSINESEWASDFMFKYSSDLSKLYPRLLHHAITSFGCQDVMRFLGQRVPLHGNAFGGDKRRISTDQRGRPEGIRIKHCLGSNSVKMYNKQGSVLRIETTLNNVKELKSPRRKPDGTVVWQPMRKGVADARQRAEVSQTANQRYAQAISSIATPRTLASITQTLSSPATLNKQRVRGLNLLSWQDASLLEAISKAQFLIHGLRNRDLQAAFFTTPAKDEKEKHRRSAQIGRKLRMLRAHGLLHKLPHTHRYIVSDKGRQIITAILAARHADIEKLAKAA